MNITTLRHDASERPSEADTFGSGTVFTVICGQVIGEVTADVAHDGTITYAASMDGCGSRDYQEDPDRLRQVAAVAGALADELEARAR
jgi:hypothetical protein